MEEYHLVARIDGTDIRISTLLNKAKPPQVPTTSLHFQPTQSEITSFPVTVYWKSTLPVEMVAAAEQAILDYCSRLYNESPYSGPIDCCL